MKNINISTIANDIQIDHGSQGCHVSLSIINDAEAQQVALDIIEQLFDVYNEDLYTALCEKLGKQIIEE